MINLVTQSADFYFLKILPPEWRYYKIHPPNEARETSTLEFSVYF